MTALLDVEDPKLEVDPIPKVKAAGEGAQVAKNPFESWKLPELSEEDYKAIPASPQVAKTKSSDLISKAKAFIGTPYKWGGSGPLGFDCSGFVQYVFKQFGVDLPRVSYQQAKAGKRISLDQLRPGDLVAWDNSTRNNGADHIAIYIGNGKVIHAPKPGDAVKISSLWDTAHAWGVAMNM